MSQPGPLLGEPQPASPGQRVLLPPEQKFWKRHSPHHEFSLSTFITTCLYLSAGILLWYSVRFVTQQVRDRGPLPLDSIGVTGDDKVASASGDPGKQRRDEDPGKPPDGPKPAPPPVNPPTIQVPGVPAPVLPRFDEPGEHPIPGVRFDPLPGDAPKQPGPALTPGPGPGAGDPSNSPGSSGHGTIDVRQQSWRRWQIDFRAVDAEDYLRQLAGLGAIVAVPEIGGGFRVFQDLHQRPLVGKVVKDLRAINLMPFRDNFVRDQGMAGGFARILGMQATPPYFVAFFPEKLEGEMARMEAAYRGHKVKGVQERIVFQVRPRGGSYELVVAENQP